jgi:hypothetical protein
MPTRHRVPTVFTLYMVDVLCCALGCVILLWFLKIHEAKRQGQDYAQTQVQRDEALQQLAGSREQVEKLDKERDQLQGQLANARGQMEAAEKERDQLRKDQAADRVRLDEMGKAVAALRTEKAAAEDRLARKVKDQQALAKELSAIKDRTATLETLVREKDNLARATARSADDLAERLRDADARARVSRDRLAVLEGRAMALEKDIDDRKKELAVAGKTLQGMQEANRALLRDVEGRDQRLAASERVIDLLRAEKKALGDEAVRVRTATDNRFAGIALTGRRVVFLVDMSGSMELVDERTPAPEKWVGVRETLAKVMRSLPHLEKYQVILFSDRVLYPLAVDGRWLDYDPKASADYAARTVGLIKPRGSTNMYAGLEAAFRFRPLGLDTIYLLSDGLPNVGEGLTTEAARNLKETERCEILSNYVRKTLRSDWNREDSAGRPRVRINTIGFFYESPDVGAFLWALARENDGSFVGMSKP